MSSDRESTLPTKELGKINMEQLRSNTYPGRGVVMGINNYGEVIQVYWLMGRSPNSQNRVLEQEGNSIVCKPFDQSEAANPYGVLFYNAMKSVITEDGINHITTNGDQTDTIAEGLAQGLTIQQALAARTYEPDPPSTPRISGVFTAGKPFTFSIIKRGENGESVHYYAPPQTQERGIGYCMHTYRQDGNPPPTYQGDPKPVLLEGSVRAIAKSYWDLLNPANRISRSIYPCL
jgi:IMP cyclohydrolase